MTEKKKEVHFGQDVKKKVKERGMTVSEFARRIIRSRSNVYDIYKREYIDLRLLQKISEVLNYNFLRKPKEN